MIKFQVDRGRDSVDLDDQGISTLNGLSRVFYRLHGCEVPEDFNFQKSKHPQEKLMFQLALEVCHFNLQQGL